jgi:3-isopropylmalate/(R)-2-methylmalate dehydratase small subunit
MSLVNLHGRAAWVFEKDDYDIDLIIGVRNIKITDVKELAALAMSDYVPDFAGTVHQGDMLIGGHNFGYGHPHYPAMRAMRHLGISCVIAESFSPGFFRGEMSMGFPLVTCPGIRAAVLQGDELEVNWDTNEVSNARTGKKLPIEPFSASERGMLDAGGLIPYLKTRIAAADTAKAHLD